MAPPRILHVTQPSDGGVARYVELLSQDQLARGFTVSVATPGSGPLAARLAALGVPSLDWPAQRNPGPGVVGELARLQQLITAYAPTLVHAHSSKAGLVTRLLLRGRRPTIFQPHGWSWLAAPRPLVPASRAWERRAAGWCDRLVCVSEAERQMGEAAGVAARWTVARTGVDLARFRPAAPLQRLAARTELGLPAGPLAVFVGRLSWAKGPDRLVGAWPRVRAAVPEATLVLVGDGEMLGSLRAAAGPGVIVAGPSPDVRGYYAAADLVVAPSRWEALSLALLEAAASGCCLVSTDVPGAREVLGTESSAVVRIGPAQDASQLIAAIVSRLADPALRRAEAAVTTGRVRTNFDQRRTFAQLAGLVEELVAEQQR